MSHVAETRPRRTNHCERGNARLNFLLVVILVGAAAYVGYQLVPVFYRASLYKDYMTGTVNKGAAMGKDSEWMREQLAGRLATGEYDLPPNPRVEAQVVENRMIVRVRWTRDIHFPGYTYRYDFDHTVKSDQFLSPK